MPACWQTGNSQEKNNHFWLYNKMIIFLHVRFILFVICTSKICEQN